MTRGATNLQRGQVFPLWVVGLLTGLTMCYLILNYANTVRWQIRAQNAADGTAQGIIAVQANEWNELAATLYASNVEEYRIRRLLNGMLLAMNDSGGCSMDTGPQYSATNFRGPLFTSTAEGSCNRTYKDLRTAYIAAVQRYSADILYVNALNYEAPQSNQMNVANYALANNYYWCNKENIPQANVTSGADCGLWYSLDAFSWRTGLRAVSADGGDLLVPGATLGTTLPTDTENATYFAPMSVDVIACAVVPPLIPNFGPFHWPSYNVIGRAAATDEMVEQDWLEPGAVCDPNHTMSTCPGPSGFNDAFQPPEDYTKIITDPGVPTTSATGFYDWYEVNFGVNGYFANYSTFNAFVVNDEMSVEMPWWGAVPILPFGPTVVVATACQPFVHSR